jgi:prophage antirepressor-like protein
MDANSIDGQVHEHGRFATVHCGGLDVGPDCGSEGRRMSDITLSRFAFDEDRGLTKVVYKGREAAIGQEFGRLLRYAHKGGKLVDLISKEWADRFREGTDYEVLKGEDLQAFKKLTTSDVVSPHAPHLMILYTSGIHLVLLNTDKPVGQTLRYWLVDTVFPSLAATGYYALPGVENQLMHQLAYMVRQFQILLNKFRNGRLQASGATQAEFRRDWTQLHLAHTGLHRWEIEKLAMARGLKGVSSMSWAEMIRQLIPVAAATEANQNDLERIGLPAQTAKEIATMEYKAYVKRILDAGIDPSAILAHGDAA